MIRVAMTLPGHGHWTGGETYLRNTLAVIRTRLADTIAPVLFLTPQEAAGADWRDLLPAPPVVSEEVAAFGRGPGLRAAMTVGVDRAAARAFAAQACDVVFEPALFYGWRLPLPAVAWLPDFQHKHLPAMFTRAQWARRELGFRAQVASGRTIMVSSETARRDAETFYPTARGRTAVVRFAQVMDVAAVAAAADAARARYDLPARFVFLPNQFWPHKNHTLVAEALALAAARGCLDRVPPIVLSGRTDDPRHPHAFDEFMTAVASAGAGTAVRHLGLIPYGDVLALAAASEALLNPSRFEGWSTPIEEAKALGVPLLIADLPVHREQAPDATFFDPHDAAALLDRLLAVQARPPRQRISVERLLAAQDARLDQHATALRAVFTTAAARRPKRRAA